jgi:uncharacterized membrane protein YiaA
VKTGYGAHTSYVRAIVMLLLLTLGNYEAGIASYNMMFIRSSAKICQFGSIFIRDISRTKVRVVIAQTSNKIWRKVG